MESTKFSNKEVLAKGRYVAFPNGKGVEVRCDQGGVWITQVNHDRDVCLGTGETFTSDSSDMVLVYAFKRSVVLSTPVVGTSAAAVTSLRTRVQRAIHDTSALLRLAVGSARHYAF